MTPEVFQTQKLLQLFYSCNPARLNKQGEGLLKLVTFDQENSTPEELIYIIDDCIKPEDNAFLRLQNKSLPLFSVKSPMEQWSQQ